MQTVTRRLASLASLSRPLTLTFVGVVLLSIGLADILIWLYQNVPVPGFFYYLTLQFLPETLRGVILILLGGGALGLGIWQLSGVAIIRLHDQGPAGDELVIGYAARKPPRIAVLSGGAGILTLSNMSRHVRELTCITPLQEPIEYYYRASGLFQSQNVHYVVPTPEAPRVMAELDDGTVINVMHVDRHNHLNKRHVKRLFVEHDEQHIAATSHQHTPDNPPTSATLRAVQPAVQTTLPLTRPARDALRNADMIILGPGSLFESIVPNLLIDDLREAVQRSKARTVYICNLMTEPGLTTGFSVGDHIRQIKEYGGFAPDYVLVNVQRIDSEIHTIYAAANQAPVYLTPEDYEETLVPRGENVTQSHLMIEDSLVIEADLASSVVQYNTSINNPGESRAVRVLRHDPEKLTTAILEILRYK